MDNSNINELIYALVSDKAKAPTQEPESVGYDVYSFGDHVINPHETKIIPLGFHAAVPHGMGCFVWDRSSFGSKGIHVYKQLITNPVLVEEVYGLVPFGGVMDWSYRGQWGAILHNSTTKIVNILHGIRVCQFVIQRCELLPTREVSMEELLEIPSARGMKGLGCSDGQNTEQSAQESIAGAKVNEPTTKTESNWKKP